MAEERVIRACGALWMPGVLPDGCDSSEKQRPLEVGENGGGAKLEETGAHRMGRGRPRAVGSMVSVEWGWVAITGPGRRKHGGQRGAPHCEHVGTSPRDDNWSETVVVG